MKISKSVNLVSPEDIFNVLNAEKSVSRKASEGGTSPKNVKKAAVQWLKRLKDEK